MLTTIWQPASSSELHDFFFRSALAAICGKSLLNLSTDKELSTTFQAVTGLTATTTGYELTFSITDGEKNRTKLSAKKKKLGQRNIESRNQNLLPHSKTERDTIYCGD